MRRGDVYLVSLDGDPDALVPAVLVSNDGANAVAAKHGRGVVTVVPVSMQTRRVLPFQTYLPAAATGLARNAKAQAEQVRSIDGARLVTHVGSLPPDLLRELDAALRLHLGLS
jgi:mRNA interferase MazF